VNGSALRNRLWLVVQLVGLLLITTGCSTALPPDGRWIATDATPQTLVADAPITITFGSGRVSGNAGCNAFSGPAVVEAGTLKVAQVGSTLMYCGGPRGEQETWFFALLSSSPTITITDTTLVLAGASSTVTFRRAP
jgi:heat shock protein HslJ